MIINRNSWHYKVYDFTYWWGGGVPLRLARNTNLCQYVKRIVFGAPWWAFLFVCMACAMTVIIVCATLFGPIFGYVPKTIHPIRFFDNDMRKYQGWKLGKAYNAFQIYPWHVILAVIVLGIEVLSCHAFGLHPLVVQGEIVGGIIVFVGIIFGLLAYFDSSTGKVVNEYLAAKKQKVCPVVEFKNEEQAP